MAGADSLTSGEQAQKRRLVSGCLQLQNARGAPHPTVNETDVSKGWKPVNKVEKIEINVDGSKDPKATSDAIKDELSAHGSNLRTRVYQ
jgi:hypothetical protein